MGPPCFALTTCRTAFGRPRRIFEHTSRAPLSLALILLLLQYESLRNRHLKETRAFGKVRRSMSKHTPRGGKTPKAVQLRHPHAYISSCMVNRFFLVREEGFLIAHFGLVNGVGEQLDHFACTLPEHSLKDLKENLVQYSELIGLPKSGCPKWSPKTISKESDQMTPIVDFIHLTNWEDAYAEICFWNYSRASLADLGRTKQSEAVIPWGIAILRCGIDLQRSFLAELYSESRET